MAYERREVTNYKTVLDKELYDNLQDGIDEAKEAIDIIISNNVVTATVEEENS